LESFRSLSKPYILIRLDQLPGYSRLYRYLSKTKMAFREQEHSAYEKNDQHLYGPPIHQYVNPHQLMLNQPLMEPNSDEDRAHFADNNGPYDRNRYPPLDNVIDPALISNSRTFNPITNSGTFAPPLHPEPASYSSYQTNRIEGSVESRLLAAFETPIPSQLHPLLPPSKQNNISNRASNPAGNVVSPTALVPVAPNHPVWKITTNPPYVGEQFLPYIRRIIPSLNMSPRPNPIYSGSNYWNWAGISVYALQIATQCGMSIPNARERALKDFSNTKEPWNVERCWDLFFFIFCLSMEDWMIVEVMNAIRAFTSVNNQPEYHKAKITKNSLEGHWNRAHGLITALGLNWASQMHDNEKWRAFMRKARGEARGHAVGPLGHSRKRKLIEADIKAKEKGSKTVHTLLQLVYELGNKCASSSDEDEENEDGNNENDHDVKQDEVDEPIMATEKQKEVRKIIPAVSRAEKASAALKKPSTPTRNERPDPFESLQVPPEDTSPNTQEMQSSPSEDDAEWDRIVLANVPTVELLLLTGYNLSNTTHLTANQARSKIWKSLGRLMRKFPTRPPISRNDESDESDDESFRPRSSPPLQGTRSRNRVTKIRRQVSLKKINSS
jgi:hypothetical protein